MPRLLAWLPLVVALSAVPAHAQDASALAPGQWVQVKGSLDDEGRFVASQVEVLQPERREELIGTVTRYQADKQRFFLLGQEVRISARTEWDGITPDELAGSRIKLSGRYQGPRKFSAREIRPRKGAGRDRLMGRVDRIRELAGGWELRIMRFDVFVPGELQLEHEEPLEQYERLEPQPVPVELPQRDEDDEFVRSVDLAEGLTLGGRLEWRSRLEDNYDLEDAKREDRLDHQAAFRTEIVWEPNADFYALGRTRSSWRRRSDEGEPIERETNHNLAELYGYWRAPFGGGVDLQVGRQDFDEPREWLYDENLDAVRAIWRRPGLTAELSVSTVEADGGRRNRDLTNVIAYVSNGDWDRHLAAYVVDRREHSGPRDRPIHMGVRALGEWFEDHESWFEYSVLRGYVEQGDLSSYGLDVGTTWEPDSLEPFYFTLGYAFGSGDADPTDGEDGNFRQTGLQDNNAKLGGVTSFRYYGEVVDPELSNLKIVTAGIGARPAPRTSIDLVFHDYRQVEGRDRQRNTDLDQNPTGDRRDLGWGWDLILGHRAWDNWHFEVVFGEFHPGDAFAVRDKAWLAKFEARFRF